MAELSEGQRATRERFERMIAAAAPFLDIVLGVGERISRIAEPTDHEYYPIRAGAGQRLPAGPAARPQAGEPPAEAPPADGEDIEDAVVIEDGDAGGGDAPGPGGGSPQ